MSTNIAIHWHPVVEGLQGSLWESKWCHPNSFWGLDGILSGLNWNSFGFETRDASTNISSYSQLNHLVNPGCLPLGSNPNPQLFHGAGKIELEPGPQQLDRIPMGIQHFCARQFCFQPQDCSHWRMLVSCKPHNNFPQQISVTTMLQRKATLVIIPWFLDAPHLHGWPLPVNQTEQIFPWMGRKMWLQPLFLGTLQK